MYGLNQAAILVYGQLIKNLEKFGYEPVKHSLSIRTNYTYTTKFFLHIDDFGIKYFNKEDVEHMLQALKSLYQGTTDWIGKNCYGMFLDWYYKEVYVDMSMLK